jgi:hypothetical protein
MILKPRIATSIAMIPAGFFIFALGAVGVLGAGFRVYYGLVGIFCALFALLGIFWISMGIASLAKRKKLSITIDESGISIPTGNRFRSQACFIPKENIAAISKHESMKGRLIEITLQNGEKAFIQARQYCELDKFLSYCKENGLPVR